MKDKIIELIRYILALLFLYTGYIKIIDFDVFETTLIRSTLINESFIPFLQYFLPFLEISLFLILMINKFFKFGLHFSLFILLLFTFYLIALNDFSFYDGCSCGGIFNEMSYPQHVLINFLFIGINILAVFLIKFKKPNTLIV